MKDWQLHPAQIATLDVLRHTESARFRDLLRSAGMDSDVFKFHVRKLVSQGLAEKQLDGSYQLTPLGKEFANNLDEAAQTTQKQPKVSVLLLVRQPGGADEPRYLFQRRRRHPYYDFWGSIGGPVGWGETVEATAARELTKQTELTAVFEVRCALRKRDYGAESQQLLEDKLFMILEAANVQGELGTTWQHGENAWLTAEEFTGQPKRFDSSVNMIEWVRAGKTFVSEEAYYAAEDY
jgi:ADP-ribose pyrophosphatase YjhB (NUDIX family)